MRETGLLLTAEQAGGDLTPAQSSTSGGQAGTWVFAPVEEYLTVPGVTAATRVGAYPVAIVMGNRASNGALYGVDRLEFPQVAFFRSDFAPSSLGALMNHLAERDRILVHPDLLADYQLAIGDAITLSFGAFGERRTIPFVIADVVDYFPTYYPDEARYLFVANLDYIFDQLGTMFPYDVWLRADPRLDAVDIRDEATKQSIQVANVQGWQQSLEAERSRPERIGFFGILSVGFAAAAFLTVLGFLLHAFISFRRRFIEFGILRAIGLSLGQMVALLALEQLLLIMAGVTVGTALGASVSRLFVPFLHAGESGAQVPPFVVHIAWNNVVMLYITFAAMLVFLIGGLIWFLSRLKTFEAVKLGEAV